MDAAPHPTAETGFAAAPPVAPPDEARPGSPDEPEAELLVEDLLVEEVSIDGMCGVY